MRVYLENISHRFGSHTIFENTSFEIFPGRKTALVGANGSGKSTLFRIITGELEPESGRVVLDRGRVGLVEQEFTLDTDTPLFKAAAEVFAGIREQETLIREMESSFSTLSEGEKARYASLTEEFERSGGYEWERRTAGVLFGMGFTEEDFSRPVGGFSGGQRRRLLLARALLKDPDLLLLDEPTNHLDLEAIDWLENWLSGWKGGLVFISHDRHFINRVAEEIVELDRGVLERYPAPFDAYRRERHLRREQRLKEYQAQQDFIRKNEDFIRRNIAGQKTKQAQSRRRMLEKIELLEPPTRDASYSLSISKNVREGKRVLTAEQLGFAYPGADAVFRDIDFTLWRGERVGLLGRNGCGKSTLLKMAAGVLSPTYGRLGLDERVTAGYFPQEGGVLDPEMRAMDAVWEEIPAESEETVRSTMGAFLFSEAEAEKRIGLMSGGEKSRILFIKLMLARPNLLIMDEPTNHLDLPSRILLENMLSEYDGSVLLVSHDRAFLDEVVTTVYHMADGALTRYEGNVSENRERIFASGAGEVSEDTVREKPVPPAAPLSPEERSRQAARGANKFKIGKLEEKIGVLEDRAKECESEMLSESAIRDGRVFREIEDRLAGINEELEALYAEWEALCGT